MPPPGVITGGTQPLMLGMTARPLRYTPVAGEFVIRNGKEFFNRPLYGVSSPTQSGDFRVDAGDLPEFSLYLPGHGGNLKLGFIAANGRGSKWGSEADEVIARYRPGRMIYEIRDALLGAGTLRIEVLTTGTGQGFIVKAEGIGVPVGTHLAWAFGGVSGKRGKRNGDIGCEVEPVSQFFQVRAKECEGNVYSGEIASPDSAARRSVGLDAQSGRLTLTFPSKSELSVVDFVAWSKAPGAEINHLLPNNSILTGTITNEVDLPLFITVRRLGAGVDVTGLAFTDEGDVAKSFSSRSAELDELSETLLIDTPDEYVNATGGAVSVAAETIWDAKQECVMHGGVAWRVALAGWRGPYSLDALGHHDRAKLHFRHWLKRQNVTAVDASTERNGEAVGPWDAANNHARKEGLLHSNGDLSNNHYDMNLVFFDVLLRHVMWTGDMEFAREMWPAFQRHLAWERRLFRRTYASAAGKELPLYEAYAAIWASDNLQYNGGGAAHSSAYNVFALQAAAKIANLLGEDGSAYAAEAELIHEAMQQLLWVKERGLIAESKDLLGPQTVYANPALWTVYHTIDSEVPTAQQAWQMCAERLTTLKMVPVHGPGVPDGGWYMLSCSDWLPYVWSLNLLVLAENMHMALALWQAGMRDEAYRLFKGNLLDSMYMGLCPGDFHMTSALDVHRQEAQRDFGDPIGITSRAIVEGLFGVRVDLLTGEVRLRPGFPVEWDRASLKHKDFDFAWKRVGMQETVEFTSRLAKAVPVVLLLPAKTTSLPAVMIRGQAVKAEFDTEAVGNPVVRVELAEARDYAITLDWHGHAPSSTPPWRSYQLGEKVELPQNVGEIKDPQDCLHDGRVALAGFHTVFAKAHEADAEWLIPISFTANAERAEFAAVPQLSPSKRMQQVNLTAVMKDRVTEVFTRGYVEPRSPYCSLAVADTLLGGWANPDGKAMIDDAGLRAAGGLLRTAIGVDFATPMTGPNCLFVSHWKQDAPSVNVALSGRSEAVYLLMAGTTLPQCSRIQHGVVSITYADKSTTKLPLRNPENWWPVEQDYLLDDYLFVNEAPLPPRVDLRTGRTRVLERASFMGAGRTVPGGAATVLHLPLDRRKELASLTVECELYGVVLGLLGATLVRA